MPSQLHQSHPFRIPTAYTSSSNEQQDGESQPPRANESPVYAYHQMHGRPSPPRPSPLSSQQVQGKPGPRFPTSPPVTPGEHGAVGLAAEDDDDDDDDDEEEELDDGPTMIAVSGDGRHEGG